MNQFETDLWIYEHITSVYSKNNYFSSCMQLKYLVYSLSVCLSVYFFLSFSLKFHNDFIIIWLVDHS